MSFIIFLFVQADKSGTIVEILADDAKPVSVDMVTNLFLIHSAMPTFSLSSITTFIFRSLYLSSNHEVIHTRRLRTPLLLLE